MIRRSKRTMTITLSATCGQWFNRRCICKQHDLDQAYFSLRRTQLCNTDEAAFIPVARMKQHATTTNYRLQCRLESCSLNSKLA